MTETIALPPCDHKNPATARLSPITTKICAYPGCNRKARNKGKSASGAGGYRFGRYCKEHHKFTGITGKKSLIDNTIPCEICGWDKSVCDRHRTSPDIRYHRTEVVIVCPNCHRLIGSNKMRVRRLKDGKVLVTGPCVKEIRADGRIVLRGISEYTGTEVPLEPKPESTLLVEDNQVPPMPTSLPPVDAPSNIGVRVNPSTLAKEVAAQNVVKPVSKTKPTRRTTSDERRNNRAVTNSSKGVSQ